MTKMTASDNSPGDRPRATANGKKSYEKPAFQQEQAFVTTALSCGKISVTQSSCTINLKIS